MQFSIAAQLKQPGLVGHYEADVHLPAQSYMGRTVAFHGPLHVEARYVYDGESLLVQGTVTAILNSVWNFKSLSALILRSGSSKIPTRRTSVILWAARRWI